MKSKKTFVITTTFFFTLLFLSSLEYASTGGCPKTIFTKLNRPNAYNKNKSTTSLRRRFDRFSGRQKDINEKLTQLQRKIQKSYGSKRGSLEREFRHLEQRHTRITNRLKQLEADIKRIEGTK